MCLHFYDSFAEKLLLFLYSLLTLLLLLLLSLLSFLFFCRVPLTIVNKAHQANQIYPYAISLIESVRTYERTLEKVYIYVIKIFLNRFFNAISGSEHKTHVL